MQIPIPEIPLPPGMVRFNSGPWTPVGAVMAYAGPLDVQTSPPEKDRDLEAGGWMLCDGRELEVLKYPELFNVIGSRYGGIPVKDNPRTFNIPDYRGMFLRGVDHGSGNDPDVTDRQPPANGGKEEVGSTQEDALESHRHCYQKVETPAAPAQAGKPAIPGMQDTTPTTGPTVDEEGACSKLEKVSKNETRPVNTYVNFIIKFTNYPAWSRQWPNFPFPGP